eukprot:gnl/TRDRNA2_/TRDRNA2_173955_c3_seq1.p2 gnl/TRDRNA2_/TRDRNA2_173955_c3~~gnl/TRDRNA2_/TRDRNA2_173955_c3_seq1.p2  ORF type:complete len:144 (+),score=14.33 gnl/TRDRNA2_/TRDRNA2_173955_c3_seq1:69-500(+)
MDLMAMLVPTLYASFSKGPRKSMSNSIITSGIHRMPSISMALGSNNNKKQKSVQLAIIPVMPGAFTGCNACNTGLKEVRSAPTANSRRICFHRISAKISVPEVMQKDKILADQKTEIACALIISKRRSMLSAHFFSLIAATRV